MFLIRILFVLMGLGLYTAAAQDGRAQIGDSEPMPLSGSTTMFNYWKSGPTSSYYVVQSAANTGFSFMVSDNFLGLVLQSPQVDDKTRLSMLAQYPFFMNALYTDRMSTNYPAADRSYETPFETVQSEGLSIVQDDMASPYVRVRVVNPDGTVEEFSINRDLVDRILAEQDWETTNLVGALQSYPYRLPENARANFRHLTKEQIMEMAESTPGVARQEFVRTRQLYSQPQHAQTMSNAAVVAAENTPSEPMPSASESSLKPVAAPVKRVVEQAAQSGAPEDSTQPGRGRRVLFFSLIAAVVGAAFVLGRQSGHR